MKKTQRLQEGFGIIEALLLLIIISIIGFTGWFVLQSQKTTDTVLEDSNISLPAATQGKSSQNTAGQFFAIKEWGVKFKKPSQDAQFIYAPLQDMAGSGMAFGTDQSEELGNGCKVSAGGIGILMRLTQKSTQEASPPAPLNDEKPINGYYYYYSRPQALCSDGTASQRALELNAVDQVQALLRTVEAN